MIDAQTVGLLRYRSAPAAQVAVIDFADRGLQPLSLLLRSPCEALLFARSQRICFVSASHRLLSALRLRLRVASQNLAALLTPFAAALGAPGVRSGLRGPWCGENFNGCRACLFSLDQLLEAILSCDGLDNRRCRSVDEAGDGTYKRRFCIYMLRPHQGVPVYGRNGFLCLLPGTGGS